jgi:hypothetical protein
MPVIGVAAAGQTKRLSLNNSPPQTISPAPSKNISLPTNQPIRPTQIGIWRRRAKPQTRIIGLLAWLLAKAAINVTTATTIHVNPIMKKTERSAFLRPRSRFDVARSAETLGYAAIR